jgi:hypothetical protein
MLCRTGSKRQLGQKGTNAGAGPEERFQRTAIAAYPWSLAGNLAGPNGGQEHSRRQIYAGGQLRLGVPVPE